MMVVNERVLKSVRRNESQEKHFMDVENVCYMNARNKALKKCSSIWALDF